MKLADKVVVVTGGGSGIGAALVLAFIAEGAGAVAVVDRDPGQAETVARRAGDRAVAMGCDVSDESQVRATIDRVEAELGAIDLFVANAGIGSGMGLEADDATWNRVLGVNLWAQVFAARRLIPAWTARGHGYFLTTASAAGLLTQIGDAPYAISKHAAIAFAEWLSVTYGAAGVRVGCLCPMGVDTPLYRNGLGASGEPDLGVRVVAASGSILTPAQVADVVVQAIDRETFLILPHPEVEDFVRRKATDRDRWLAGMRRLQQEMSRGE